MEQNALNSQTLKNRDDISEIRGRLEALATKEFVREVVNDQTLRLESKIDTISGKIDKLNEKQFRIVGAVDFLKSALPMLVSVATLIVLIFSLLTTSQ